MSTGLPRKRRIDELGLSRTAYYYTRGLLSEEELQGDIGRRLAFSLAFIVSVILLFL